jgi:DNA-binding transcriptional ArsR family regulator
MATHPQLVGDEPEPEQLTKDTVFSVLSNQRRRRVLRCLRDEPDGSNIRELSRRIAAWENEVPVDEVTYKQRKRVYTSLHQTHLPKLADAHVIDYDRDRGTVALTDHAATLDDFLTASDAPSVPWPRIYLAVATAGVVATLLATAGLLPPGVPDVAVAGAIAFAVAVVAGIHSYTLHGGSVLSVVGDRTSGGEEDD